VALIVGLAILAGGCANQNSIFRYKRVHGNQPVIVTEDAKQRNLMMLPETDGRTRWRVCAEASPDVFSALSTSASGDFGFGSGGGQTDAQAKAALAIAEAAGTIERTQTINMLRESMYRTCERYMSGAIDKATFVVQAGRDWRAMIAILAIEQLTRTARPASTIISAGSTTATVQSGADVLRQLAVAQREVDSAQAGLTAATAAQSGAGDPADCSTAADKPGCAARARDVASAQTRLDRATHNLGIWEAVAKNPPPPNQMSAGTGAGTNNPGGGGGGGPSDTAIMHVADVIDNIVTGAFATDETQLFCLQTLSTESNLRPNPQLEQKCIEYLLQKVESDRARLYGSAPVRVRVDAAVPAALQARALALNYLRGLTAEKFAQDAPIIRRSIPFFCRSLTLVDCIANVENGGLDGNDPQNVAAAIQERMAGGGGW
jgi:hypothetical protein